MKRVFMLAAAMIAAPADAAAEARFAPFATLRLVDGVRVMTTPPDYTAFTSSHVTIVEQADGLIVGIIATAETSAAIDGPAGSEGLGYAEIPTAVRSRSSGARARCPIDLRQIKSRP